MEPRLKWSEIILAAKITIFYFRRGARNHVWNKI